MLKEPVSMVKFQSFCRRAARKLGFTDQTLTGSVEVDTSEEAAIVVSFGQGKSVEKLVIALTKERAKGGGKSKGDQGEREVGRLLSEWWGKPNSFYRSAGSGSRFTSRKDNREHPGDLVVPDGLNFVLEIKRCEMFDLDVWFRDCFGSSFISKALKQSIEAAVNSSKWPILIGRRNNYPWMVLFPSALVDPNNTVRFCDASIRRLRNKRYSISGNSDTPPISGWFVLELDQFLMAVSPKDCMSLGQFNQIRRKIRGGR